MGYILSGFHRDIRTFMRSSAGMSSRKFMKDPLLLYQLVGPSPNVSLLYELLQFGLHATFLERFV